MAVSANTEGIREKGLGLEVVGGIVWFFDFLLLFFLPAGVKLGHKGGFVALMIGLFVVGLVLMGAGYAMRARAERR